MKAKNYHTFHYFTQFETKSGRIGLIEAKLFENRHKIHLQTLKRFQKGREEQNRITTRFYEEMSFFSNN